ncbi:Multidrug resistance protein (function not yet clear) [Staphylococcus aureus]|nr:Multidrug resistance protein (function not yet clear) [Staphylococcus aureus]
MKKMILINVITVVVLLAIGIAGFISGIKQQVI